jgi:hypothetical protein
MILYNSLLEDHPDGIGDLNAIINGNWRTLERWINPAEGLTASQSGTTVLASGPVFRSSDVGATIRFSDGTVRTITAVVDEDEVTVTPSGTVASQGFWLYRTTESPRTALVRGLIKSANLSGHSTGEILMWDNTRTRFELVPGFVSGTASGAQVAFPTGAIGELPYATRARVNVPASGAYLVCAQVEIAATVGLNPVTIGIYRSTGTALKSITYALPGTDLIAQVFTVATLSAGDQIQIWGLNPNATDVYAKADGALLFVQRIG